uniref:Uncharacterized protein n=1 Tax=Capitella teleta TaxID=283909 RepID=X1ZKS4_CAPTE
MRIASLFCCACSAENVNLIFMDFHSIFAQNNLLLSPEAKTSSGELRWPHAQSAPSLKRIPDRPQTLNHVTRPPECHALKGQDWKFYVQGDWSYNSLPNKRKVDANFFFTIPSKTPRVVDNHAAPPKEFTVIKTNLGWDNLHRNDHVTQRVRVINMPASVPHQSKPDNHRLQEVKKRERNCRVKESKDDFCSALSVVAQPLELAQIASLRNERRSRSESPDKRTRVKVKRSRSKSKESDRTSLYSTQMLDSNTSRSTQTKQTSKALLENNRRESPSKYRKEVSSNCTQSPSKSNRQSYRRSSKDYGTSDSEQECDCKECRNLPDRLLKSGVIQKASRNNFAPLELQNSRCKPVVLSSPTSPSKSFVKCQERKDLKKQSLNGLKSAPPLVIPVPSREQRRVRAKPQMPVIVEDVAQKTEEHLSSSSGTSTLTREKPKPVNSPDSCESGIVSDAGHVAPVSLLDAMYRKYCSNRHTQTTVASPVAPDLEPAYLGVKSPRPARSPSSAASDTDFSLSLPPREGWMSGQPSVSPDSGHSSAANTLSSTGSSASPSPPEPVEAKLEDEIIASEQQQQQNEMSPAPPSHLSETEILVASFITITLRPICPKTVDPNLSSHTRNAKARSSTHIEYTSMRL